VRETAGNLVRTVLWAEDRVVLATTLRVSLRGTRSVNARLVNTNANRLTSTRLAKPARRAPFAR